MRRDFLRQAAMLLAAPPLVAFARQEPDSAPLAGRLRITGSATMAPLIEKLAILFSARYPAVTIAVEAGGSRRGATDVLEGKADIGMASRAPAADERILFAIPIARDGVSVVVHRANPLAALSRSQLLALFTGATTDWRALGGRAARVEVVTQSAAHGTLEVMAEYLGIAPAAIKAAHVLDGNAAVARLIASNRDAIGFMSTAAADDAGQSLKPLALDGIAPGSGTVRDGTWPLSRPLNLLTRRVPTGAARAFIEFALSPPARDVIVEHGFVPYAALRHGVR